MGPHAEQAQNWLTDAALTEQGKGLRKEYQDYCEYLDRQGLLSFQTARIKYFMQRLNYWTLPDGYALPPHTINVCVNNKCNLKCSYCDFGQGESETFYHKYNVVSDFKIELPLDVCTSIVDQVKWFKPIIRASFREPMLYSNIIPFIEYTKQNGLPFWLLTNGFNLAKYAEQLVTLKVDSIRLSLDGPEELHNTIRGAKNVYGKMMEGVKLLIQERERQKTNMQIGFYFTLNDSNHKAMTDTIDQLHKEGVLKQVFFNFQWLNYTTKTMAQRHNAHDAAVCGGSIQESTVQNVDIFNMDLKKIHEQYKEIRRKYPADEGYRIHFRPSFEYDDLVKYLTTEDFLVEKPRCMTPWYNMNINPNGDVKTFHHCLLPDVGNVKEHSIIDIWNGEKLRAQRRLLKEKGAYAGCARCWGAYALLEDAGRKSR